MKALIPNWLRSLTYNYRQRRHRKRERQRWEALGATFSLDGFEVSIRNRSDWMVYNEIFVGGVYDDAIDRAIDLVEGEGVTRMIDLGANTGFFALRAAHRCTKSRAAPVEYVIDCFEGSPSNFRELEVRIREQSRVEGRIRPHLGLVGSRTGEGQIFESTHGAGSSTVDVGLPASVGVPYIDLESVVGDDGTIALLKCDIEGAELEFLRNYPKLMERVSIAVFELHHDSCDTDECRERIRTAGLATEEILSERPRTMLAAYHRA